MNRLRTFFRNPWVKFSLATLIYVLWFVVWTRNAWWLLGVPLLYDYFITHYHQRLFGRRHAALKERSRVYKTAAEWIGALVFAVVFASIAHLYLFQLYVIPSSSMEKSLLVGDYLYVSKAAYGPKMPNTPLSFPLVHHTLPFSQTHKSYSEAIRLKYKRLRGLGTVGRGDIVVFNFPAGDTVLLEQQEVTYYDVAREYIRRLGPKAGRERLARDYTIVSRPPDKREHYVKRCIALPGDTILVDEGRVWINGQPEPSIPGRQYYYTVETDRPIPPSAFRRLGITEASGDGRRYGMPLTDELRAAVEKLPGVLHTERYIARVAGEEIFPADTSFHWTQDRFGPLWVPYRGATVSLTRQNLPLYRRIIETYEGNRLETDGERILINGRPTSEYTFQMDYYFMMGDNRHNSADSRFWGFVPEDHIVGRAAVVLFSLDHARSFPANIRWNRLFRSTR